MEKFCFLLLCLLLTALNSRVTTVQFMFGCVDHWWAWSTVSAGSFQKYQYVVLNSSETPATGNDNLPTHCEGYCNHVITDHNVSNMAVCVSCSYGGLCGSCCYFEQFRDRLTIGCESLLSLILFPLSGPAGGERSRLHSLLWMCLDVWMSVFNLSVTVQSSRKLRLYIFWHVTMTEMKLPRHKWGPIYKGNPKIKQRIEKTMRKLAR